MKPLEPSDIERQAYMVLGVLPGVTDEEVKRAYRYLAKMHHPDVSPEGDGAASKFRLITQAYQYIRQGGTLDDYSLLTQVTRTQTGGFGRQTVGLVYSSYGLDTARFDLIKRCLSRANIGYSDKTVASGEGGFTTIYQEISVKPEDEKRARNVIRRALSSKDRIDGAFAVIAVMGIWVSVIGFALSVEIPRLESLIYIGFGICLLSVVVKAVYDHVQS